MKPIIVGILNVTPDSFYDGGRYDTTEKAIQQGQKLIREGADVLDIGGESTRPGAEYVSIAEECARIVDVVQALSPSIPISIDTTKPEVAHAALLAGASILNDVQGLQNPRLMEMSADFQEVVIMHSRGNPKTMKTLTDYSNLLHDLYRFFATQIKRCPCPNIWIDPGIGFAKTASQSRYLLRNTAHFTTLGHPVYIGASRKSFIAHSLSLSPTEDRLPGSLAALALAFQQGASAFRVHDVAQSKQFLDMLIAIEDTNDH